MTLAAGLRCFRRPPVLARWVAALLLPVLLGAAAPPPPAAPPGPLLAATWGERWEEAKNWFAAQTTGKSRLVQLGFLGMILALYILYRAKPRG